MTMKQLFTILLAVCSLVLNSSVAFAAKEGEKVEVMLLHPGTKCPTCAAIRTNTLKVVNETFKKDVAAGRMEFKEVVYGNGQNEDLKERFDVEMSTIILFKRDAAGKELEVKSLGKFPASNARSNPEKYRKELTKMIYFFKK